MSQDANKLVSETRLSGVEKDLKSCRLSEFDKEKIVTFLRLCNERTLVNEPFIVVGKSSSRKTYLANIIRRWIPEIVYEIPAVLDLKQIEKSEEQTKLLGIIQDGRSFTLENYNKFKENRYLFPNLWINFQSIPKGIQPTITFV
jgi:hypothetical protein